MEKKQVIAGFIALTELYLKTCSPSEKFVSSDEVELFIGSIDKSNLSIALGKPGTESPCQNGVE